MCKYVLLFEIPEKEKKKVPDFGAVKIPVPKFMAFPVFSLSNSNGIGTSLVEKALFLWTKKWTGDDLTSTYPSLVWKPEIFFNLVVFLRKALKYCYVSS